MTVLLFPHVSKSRYCKRGYFPWGKISRKCWQDISHGGNFHDTSPIFFIKAYGFYFRVGVIFAKKTKARKTRKLPPRENFHVYSNQFMQLNPFPTVTTFTWTGAERHAWRSRYWRSRGQIVYRRNRRNGAGLLQRTLMTYQLIVIIYSSRAISLPSLKFLRQSVL